MSSGSITGLVAGADLLASACPAEPQVVPVPRRPDESPSELAARLTARGVSRAVLLDAPEGERPALLDAGIDATAWPHDAPPVSDRFYCDTEPTAGSSRVFFSGPVNDERDRLLNPVKHRFDLLHLVGGGDPGTLAELMGRCSIAIDLRGNAELDDADRIGPAMAAGMLVIAEAPVEREGLTPTDHLLTFSDADELEELIDSVVREPEAFLPIRRAGREAAERWRASVVLAG